MREKIYLIAMISYSLFLVWSVLELFEVPYKIKVSFRQHIARKKNRKAYRKHLRAAQQMKNN
jgi:hypothetical protein